MLVTASPDRVAVAVVPVPPPNETAGGERYPEPPAVTATFLTPQSTLKVAPPGANEELDNEDAVHLVERFDIKLATGETPPLSAKHKEQIDAQKDVCNQILVLRALLGEVLVIGDEEYLAEHGFASEK